MSSKGHGQLLEEYRRSVSPLYGGWRPSRALALPPRIEGVRLTDVEVERLLNDLDVGSFSSRDEEEVAGYAEVMELVFENWQEISLTENHIKHLHRDLLKYSSKDQRHRGEYKTLNNHVEAFGPNGESMGVIFQTASPFDTPGLMAKLVDWTGQNLETGEWHPLTVIAIFVVVFLEIHPFQDGNGRLSRILTTLLLLARRIQLCDLQFPWRV